MRYAGCPVHFVPLDVERGPPPGADLVWTGAEEGPRVFLPHAQYWATCIERVFRKEGAPFPPAVVLPAGVYAACGLGIRGPTNAELAAIVAGQGRGQSSPVFSHSPSLPSSAAGGGNAPRPQPPAAAAAAAAAVTAVAPSASEASSAIPESREALQAAWAAVLDRVASPR